MRSCARPAVVRQLSQSTRLQQLPSSGNMKSEEQWIASDNNNQSSTNKSSSNSAINKVVQSARILLDSALREPPLHVVTKYMRKFEAGTTYDPFDFSLTKLGMEQRAYKQKMTTKSDPFEASGINPLDLYTMPEILSKFLTSTGQILPRDVTGCSSSNQKKLGIAIKRSRACGLLSSVHKHSRYLPSRNI